MTCEPMPLLPTPTARDWKDGVPTDNVDENALLGRVVWSLPHSAPVSADSTSPSQPPSEPSQPGSARPIPTAAPCSSATGPVSTCCPTCGRSTQDTDPSTCCTPATPASRSPGQASDSERPTPGTFGPRSSEPFAYFDPVSSCWRTSQLTFDSDSTPCSPTLPAWGSLRNGELFERPTWEPRTDGHGSLSLPTPTGRDHKGRNQRDDDSCLPLLPTPTSQAAKHGEQAPSEAPGLRPQDDFNLWTAMQRLPGASTSQPSADGNTPSDGQRPDQLTIEDA